MSAQSKLQLLIELKNKLGAGLNKAKQQVSKAVGGMQAKLDAFSKKNTQLFSAITTQVPGVSSALGMLANPYVLAAVAAVAAGAAIVKCTRMAADWRDKMAEINVTAEQTPEGLKKLSDKMLEIGSRNANNLNGTVRIFSLPAIFVDYQMTGQGKKQPRLVTLTLHIVVDELPDASNISEQKEIGLQRFNYCLLLQSILEGCTLNKTTQLKFISENSIDEQVVNYHTQTYEFEVYLADMLNDIERSFGEFERLNIFGSLVKKLPK